MSTNIITAQEASTPATISDYVNQYRHHARNTVQNIILLGKTVFDADRSLSQNDFKTFCNEVNLIPNGPTYRKLRIIGKMSERFANHVDMMPNSWTTVYELAKIKDNEFAKLIDGKILNKEVTSKEIKQALGAKEIVKIVKNSVNLTLKIEAKNSDMMLEIECDIHKIAEKYGVAVKVDNNDLYQRWKALNEGFETAA